MKAKHHITQRQLQKMTSKPRALITPERLYTASELQAIVDADRLQQQAQTEARLSEFLNHYDTVGGALLLIDIGYASIFGMLGFTDTPGWKTQLRAQRDLFNQGAEQALDLLTHLEATAYPNDELGRRYILIVCSEARQAILGRAADLKTAISAALEGNPSRLHELATRHDETSVRTLLLEKMRGLSTEHLAQDKRADRGGVYIGVHAHRLETEEGITSVKQQWRRIYTDLKAARAYLEGDSLAAWEYFQHWQPFNLQAEALRSFEQEISRLKRVAQQYLEAANNSRQTHDKL